MPENVPHAAQGPPSLLPAHSCLFSGAQAELFFHRQYSAHSRRGFTPRAWTYERNAVFESGHKAEWHLSNAEDFLAEAFASRRTGYRREKDGAPELLHGFERGLHGAPVGDGGGEPLVLLLRQRDTDRLALHFAGPLLDRQ